MGTARRIITQTPKDHLNPLKSPRLTSDITVVGVSIMPAGDSAAWRASLRRG